MQECAYYFKHRPRALHKETVPTFHDLNHTLKWESEAEEMFPCIVCSGVYLLVDPNQPQERQARLFHGAELISIQGCRLY